MKREIKEMVFCGTEEVFLIGYGRVHHILNKAFTLLSGLQQPPHSTSEAEARMDEYDREFYWKQMEVYVADIVCALLGPEYKIVRQMKKQECEVPGCEKDADIVICSPVEDEPIAVCVEHKKMYDGEA